LKTAIDVIMKEKNSSINQRLQQISYKKFDKTAVHINILFQDKAKIKQAY